MPNHVLNFEDNDTNLLLLSLSFLLYAFILLLNHRMERLVSDRDLRRSVAFWPEFLQDLSNIRDFLLDFHEGSHFSPRAKKKTNKMLGSRLIETLAFSLKVYGGKGNFGVALIFT